MLRIENLYKRYGKFQALNSLNMEVKEGEIYGFVGPNGCLLYTSDAADEL